MIDHNELAQEMEHIEKMPRNERVKLASKRRKEQLAIHTKWLKSDEYEATIKPRSKSRQGIKFTQDIELMEIASRNAIDEMRALLKSGVDPNQTNHDGLTALHQCCIDGSLDMVNLLIKHGANVNVRDLDLWTPLHAAATCGHFKIVALLIRAGANVTAMNGDGDMPHDIAEDEVVRQYLENELAKQGFTDRALEEIRGGVQAQLLKDINYVLSTGGDINQPLDQGGTFLHVAIANSFNDIVSLLLSNKASVTARDEEGWEPLHVAAYWGNDNAFDMLAEEEDVDLRSLTENGETPYDLCEDPELKRYILRRIDELSMKYGSVKNYTMPALKRPFKTDISDNDSDGETSTRFDDYEDTVTDTLIFNPSKRQNPLYTGENIRANEDYNNNDTDSNEDVEIRHPSDPIATASNPLLNLDASELSERRNSVREAKHLAQIKRANSNLDRHQPVPTIPEGKEMKVLEEINEGGDQSNKPKVQTNNHIFDSLNTYATQTNISAEVDNSTVTKSTSIQDEESISDERSKESNAEIYKERVTRNGNVPNLKPATQSQDQEQEQSATKITGKRSKRMAPPPPPITGRTTLTELKKQRQEARQFHTDNAEDTLSQSTFYDITNLYEPPPSPTMIRYRLKMTDEVIDHTIIKEKKCVIM